MDLIKEITTITILFFIFLVFYSKFKRQGMKESITEIKEGVGSLIGEDG